MLRLTDPDGVCGPCSEIFYHPQGIGKGGDVEIWNLVFTQFNRSGSPPDNLSPLPSKNIDTGMGLERIAATLQGVDTNFHIDTLRPVVEAAAEITGIKYEPDSDKGRFLRRITDHVRACTFSIHENVYPGASKAEYVVRRLLRRCTFEGRQLGHQEPFLYRLVPAVVDAMSRPYPELSETFERVQQVIKKEEESFLSKLDDGMIRIEKMFEAMDANGAKAVDGAEAHDLYKTFAIPVELIASLADERGCHFDWIGYEAAKDNHSRISNQGPTTVMGDFGPIDQIKKETKLTTFLGYESTEAVSKVVGIVAGESRIESIDSKTSEGQQIVLDQTPFYAESGGQVADTGKLIGDNGEFTVSNVQKNGGIFVHYGEIVSGFLRQGETVNAIVDSDNRNAIRRAHTATHILHHSLQNTLGSHAQQRGSKVTNDWLRFDFSNLEAVSESDLKTIEELTKKHIEESAVVTAEVLPLSEAKEKGAMMLFGEKYPDPVRMVSIGEFSKELCGGIHLPNSNEVDEFELISEEGVSSGTRRIEALTGEKAKAYRQTIAETISELAGILSVKESNVVPAFDQLSSNIKELKKRIAAGSDKPVDETNWAGGNDLDYPGRRDTIRTIVRSLNVANSDIVERVKKMVDEVGQLKQQLEKLSKVERVDADALLASAEEVNGAKIIVQELNSSNPNLMRQLIDQVRKKENPVAVFLATALGPDKVILVAGVSKDLVESGVRAGDWVKEVAPVVGGGGGGKPDLAQAGGKQPEKIGDALIAAKDFIAAKTTT